MSRPTLSLAAIVEAIEECARELANLAAELKPTHPGLAEQLHRAAGIADNVETKLLPFVEIELGVES